MMKIVVFLALMLTMVAQARMIGGIAMVVDNEPITLLEIKQFQKISGLSKEQTIDALIQKKLEEKAIRESAIYITPQEIEAETQNFAKKNGVDMQGLEAGLKKQNITIEQFKSDLGEKLKRDKLYAKLLRGRMQPADESELKAYYEAHQKSFKMSGDIKVTEYASKDGKSLQAKIMQPMLNIPDIKTKEKTIQANQVDPRFFALLQKTPNRSFTQVINTGKGFVSLFVKSKSKAKVLPYEKVKEAIYGRVMKEKEQALLSEYFEKKKAEAIIKVIRTS